MNHDHSHSYAGKQLIGGDLKFKELVFRPHGGKHEAHRQTQCWRGSWESYIWIIRQQEERVSHWAWLEHLKPQSPHLVMHFLQQGHASSIKPIPHNNVTPYGPTGPFSFKPPQPTSTHRPEEYFVISPSLISRSLCSSYWSEALGSFTCLCSCQQYIFTQDFICSSQHSTN